MNIVSQSFLPTPPVDQHVAQRVAPETGQEVNIGDVDSVELDLPAEEEMESEDDTQRCQVRKCEPVDVPIPSVAAEAHPALLESGSQAPTVLTLGVF